jgi:PEP-CTERM motif
MEQTLLSRSAKLIVFPSALLVCSLILIAFTQPADASPITYVFSGTASGTVGNTNFRNALLTVSATGDTSAVTGISGGTFSSNFPGGGVTFSVSGIGSGTFSNSSYVFDDQNDFGGMVGFGVNGITKCCDIIGILGTDFGSTAFATYNLQSPIGPLGFVTDPVVGDWDNVPTLLGNMTVNSYTNVSFQAGAITNAPEPSSLLLLGTGLLGIVGVMSKKQAG